MNIIDQSLEVAQSILPEACGQRKRNSMFHFAFGYNKSKLLAIGQNNPEKTNAKAWRLSQKFNTDIIYPYLHAETDLVSKLWGRHYIDNRLKIVVIRLNKNGKLRQSKPCKRCNKILKALDVNKVWWSTENGFKQAERH